MSGNVELDNLLGKLDAIVDASDEETNKKVTDRMQSDKARGANSIIYSAMWEEEDAVTLKGLKVDRQDVLNIKWILNEVEIWQSLKHGYILELKGICHYTEHRQESDDDEEGSGGKLPENKKVPYYIFLVSDFQSKGDLAGLFLPSDGSAIDEREAHVKNRRQTVVWLGQIASALAYMHGIDIVHGDIKLDNVLLSEDNSTKLCDFGHSFKSGMYKDIPKNAKWQYSAPDLLETSVRTKATDVFAFALLMYEALTGNQAYSAFKDLQDAQATLADISKRPKLPDTLEGLTPAAAENLHSLVTACWDAQPDARPDMSTVNGLLQNLDIPLGQFKAKLSVHH